MKKFYLLLVMICSVFAFAACSDDDKGPEDSTCPVTGYSVKTPSLAPGGELILEGKGFTQDSKIFLKDTEGKLTEIPVKTVSAADIVCTLPATGLAVGQYTVILRQEGSDWDMGKMTVTAALPIKDYSFTPEGISGKEFQIKGTGFKDCEIYLRPDEGEAIPLTNVVKTDEGVTAFIPATVAKGSYTLVVKQDGVEQELGLVKIVDVTKKLMKIEKFEAKQHNQQIQYESAYVRSFEYDEATGKLTGYTMGERRITLDHSTPGQITQHDGEETYIYKLTDGRADKSRDGNGDEWTWHYDGNGFITTAEAETEYFGLQTLTYGYNGQDLVTMSDGEDGSGMVIMGTITFGGYGENSPANSIDGVDLFSVIMGELSFPDSEIRYYGINGSIPARLPATVYSDEAGYDCEITYETQGKYVTKITVKDNFSSVKDNPPYYVLTWE